MQAPGTQQPEAKAGERSNPQPTPGAAGSVHAWNFEGGAYAAFVLPTASPLELDERVVGPGPPVRQVPTAHRLNVAIRGSAPLHHFAHTGNTVTGMHT